MYYGPEFISHALKQWAADRGVDLIHIQPGMEFPGFSGHLTEGGDALPRTRQD